MSARRIRREAERKAERASRRRRIATAAGVVGAGALIAPAAGQAANFPVTNTADNGAGSLRQAVVNANGAAGPDTISFSGAGASGTIRLTTGEISITDDVTITGPGAGALTVSGDKDNSSTPTFPTLALPAGGDSRIFNISDPSSPGSPVQRVTISGLTLRNGVAARVNAGTHYNLDGGAITSVATALTLNNMTFTGNVATDEGGAVYLENGSGAGSLKVTNSTFTNNRAKQSGGAIFAQPEKYSDGTPGLEVTGSQLSGNRAGGTDFGEFGFSTGPSGGAISTKYGDTRIDSTTVTNNTAITSQGGNNDGRAGGLEVSGGEISNSTISGNSTVETGGGALLRATKLRNSTVTGNTVTEGIGGGVAFGPKYTGGTSRLDNSTVSGNTAQGAAPYQGRGGGVMSYTYSGNEVALVVRNSTIASNTATNGVGGLIGFSYQEPDDATIELKSSILADNTAAGAASDLGTASGTSSPVDTSKLVSAGFTLVEAPGTAVLNGDPAGTNLTGVDPQLSPLANNGGPTQTQALAPTSPAVDAAQAGGLTTDQRGQARTVDSAATNATLSDGTDMGAFEVQDANAPGDDDVTPPTTKIKKAPKKLKLKGGKDTAKAKIKFKGSDDRGGAVTFECKLDKGKFEPCKSPLKLKLDKGKHVVEVRAVDAAGNADKSPAKAKIKVKAAKKHKHHKK
jgi:predicted outer membrane repeat protein